MLVFWRACPSSYPARQRNPYYIVPIPPNFPSFVPVCYSYHSSSVIVVVPFVALALPICARATKSRRVGGGDCDSEWAGYQQKHDLRNKIKLSPPHIFLQRITYGCNNLIGKYPLIWLTWICCLREGYTEFSIEGVVWLVGFWRVCDD